MVFTQLYDPDKMDFTDIWKMLYHARCRIMESPRVKDYIEPRRLAVDILWEAQDAAINGREPNWKWVKNAESVEQTGLADAI